MNVFYPFLEINWVNEKHPIFSNITSRYHSSALPSRPGPYAEGSAESTHSLETKRISSFPYINNRLVVPILVNISSSEDMHASLQVLTKVRD